MEGQDLPDRNSARGRNDGRGRTALRHQPSGNGGKAGLASLQGRRGGFSRRGRAVFALRDLRCVPELGGREDPRLRRSPHGLSSDLILVQNVSKLYRLYKR